MIWMDVPIYAKLWKWISLAYQINKSLTSLNYTSSNSLIECRYSESTNPFDVRQEMIIVISLVSSENETNQKVSSYFLKYLFTSQEATCHLNNAVEKESPFSITSNCLLNNTNKAVIMQLKYWNMSGTMYFQSHFGNIKKQINLYHQIQNMGNVSTISKVITSLVYMCTHTVSKFSQTTFVLGIISLRLHDYMFGHSPFETLNITICFIFRDIFRTLFILTHSKQNLRLYVRI